MKPVQLEVVAPVLSGAHLNDWGCCYASDGIAGNGSPYSCGNEYPDEWKEAVAYVAEWIRKIHSLYKHRIEIKWIDAQSPLGLWKQIRHRVFRFPAFIIDKKRTYIGWNPKELETLIDKCI